MATTNRISITITGSHERADLQVSIEEDGFEFDRASIKEAVAELLPGSTKWSLGATSFNAVGELSALLQIATRALSLVREVEVPKQMEVAFA